MDPLAHTLVGASLAQTRLGRTTTRALPTLVLGANAPDIDAVTMFISRDLSLGLRRGWTHGMLALVLLPALLGALILLADRLIARHRGRPPSARTGAVMGLSYLAVLTHPALDWLNIYGIRLLMPFDGRWFYGDALFIVDPWVWLLAGTTVVLAHSRGLSGRTAWLTLGLVATLLVTGVEGVPPAARGLWLTGLVTIGGLRAWGGVQTRLPTVATGCLLCLVTYVVAMVAGSGLATWEARGWLAERGHVPVDVMAGPVPANPFVRDVVVVDDEHYHFLEVAWLDAEPVRVSSPAVSRGPRGPIVEAALRAEHVWGLATWMRFPAFTVEEREHGYRVSIQDVRYSRRVTTGIGVAVIDLDHDLRVIPPGLARE